MRITPNLDRSDFPTQLTLNDKITIFEKQINGWIFDIAEKVSNECVHGGFAVLSIVLNYFESIGKYIEGYTNIDKVECYFKKGAYFVFPELKNEDQRTVESLLDLLYHGCRCGLYHTGITGGKIILTGEITSPLIFDRTQSLLVINPHLVVPKLRGNFQDYCNQLRNPTNLALRQNFEKRFDYLLG